MYEIINYAQKSKPVAPMLRGSEATPRNVGDRLVANFIIDSLFNNNQNSCKAEHHSKNQVGRAMGPRGSEMD